MQRFCLRLSGYRHVYPDCPSSVTGYFHQPYLCFGRPGNPDFLNYLKNDRRWFSDETLREARRALAQVLGHDLPLLRERIEGGPIAVCVVPRSKVEHAYHPSQLGFLAVVRHLLARLDGLVDATAWLRRQINTFTTHLGSSRWLANNDGPRPYPGITRDTCRIDPRFRSWHVLLIDDIYTGGVGIDEDAAAALLDAGARSLTFYAVGRTVNRYWRPEGALQRQGCVVP